MVEVGLAITVLVVAVMAMSASTFRMHTLRRQNRERTIAQNSVRTIIEQIQAISHDVAVNSPDSWGLDLVNALSPGGELGATFQVRELDAIQGQATVGTIQVFTDETLRDVDIGFDLGLPRDLNGDGAADNNNILATAAVDRPRLLPVVVTVTWRGINGQGQVDHPFYVIGY
jgi:hypothetical protein